ncbi:MAG: helix-turn-helix transcriptional regulator [Henriciella sp.]|uniref:helix-turn-helix transcriptional regulator n=1 Tax=Henriciella sp. TaxID=1968823 RepID=UPI003C796870
MSNTNPEWAEIGARLKAAREYLEISQDEAAGALGVTRSAISLIESGKRKVNAVELSRFAQLYSQSVDSFTGSLKVPPLPESVEALARAATKLSDEDREQLLSFARFLQSKQPGESGGT